MKNAITIIIVLIVSAAWCGVSVAADSAASGFREIWQKNHQDLTSYSEAYIYSIDLRDLQVKKNGRKGKLIKAPVDEEMLLRLGEVLFLNLRDNIQSVMPVNNDAQSGLVKSRRSLLLQVKLSGVFFAPDALQHTQSPSSILTGTFSFRDSQKNKDIVTIIDFQECPYDEAAINKIIKDWSRRCSLFIGSTTARLESESKPSSFFKAPILLPR
jgi:hypothetical protein